MHVDDHPWHRVLFQTQLGNIKAVSDVLRLDNELNLVAYRNVRYWRHNVVFRGGITRVQSQGVSAGGANQLRLGPAELAIRAGITEVPGELLAGDLKLQSPRRGALKVGFGPGMLAIKSQPDEHDDRSQCPDELHRRISFEEPRLLASVPGAEYGQGKPELRGD